MILDRARDREMSGVSRIWEKVNMVAEGGSRNCSKKSDDICGDEVKISSLLFWGFFFMLMYGTNGVGFFFLPLLLCTVSVCFSIV